MSELWTSFVEGIESTQVFEQLETFDSIGLFTNPWFLVPFIALIIYWVVTQQIKEIAIVGVAVMVFVFMGSGYVDGLIDARGNIQLNKILPIIGVGIGAIAIIIYLLFIRSD